MTETEREELKRLSKPLRSRAVEDGTLSPLWEVIFDAEALLAGRPSILSAQQVIAMLQRLEE